MTNEWKEHLSACLSEIEQDHELTPHWVSHLRDEPTTEYLTTNHLITNHPMTQAQYIDAELRKYWHATQGGE